MTIAKDNWSGLASLFPLGGQEMGLQSVAHTCPSMMSKGSNPIESRRIAPLKIVNP
jgi:hypothetical protein